MKKYIMVAALALVAVGCSNASTKVELTPSEVHSIGKENADMIAQALIRKAVIKEMSNYNYTPGEKEFLKTAKEDLEIDFYLDGLSAQQVNVTDEQAAKVYEANKDQLKGIKATEAIPKIKEQLFIQQQNNIKAEYINSLVEKYNINEKFKAYTSPEMAEKPMMK